MCGRGPQPGCTCWAAPLCMLPCQPLHSWVSHFLPLGLLSMQYTSVLLHAMHGIFPSILALPLTGRSCPGPEPDTVMPLSLCLDRSCRCPVLSHTLPVLCSSLCMPGRQVQHLRLIILLALVCCQHWLPIELTPKGVVFLFFFSAVNNSMADMCGCLNMLPGCIKHASTPQDYAGYLCMLCT